MNRKRICLLIIFISLTIWVGIDLQVRPKAMFLLAFNPSKFAEVASTEAIKGDLKAGPNMQSYYKNPENMKNKIEEYRSRFLNEAHSFRSSIKKSFFTVIKLVLLAFLAAQMFRGVFSISPQWINILQAFSAFLILWSLLGQLGRSIEIFSGESLPEQIDNVWFRILNSASTVVLFFTFFYQKLEDKLENSTCNKEIKIDKKLLLYGIAILFVLAIIILAVFLSYKNEIINAGLFIATVVLALVAYIQLEALRVQSKADFLFRFDKEFFGDEIIQEIIVVIEEQRNLLKGNKGKFTKYQLDNYIGYFELMSRYVKEGVVDFEFIDDTFGHYISSAWRNKEVKEYVDRLRAETKDPRYYESFQKLATRVIDKENAIRNPII